MISLVGGVPAHEVRQGMRVRAEWLPESERTLSMANIRWFAPTGELADVTPDDAHPGIRLRALFASPTDEEAAEGAGWGGFGITGWERTGEPDVPADQIKQRGTGGAI
jgi:hypothetical protein